MKKKTSDEESDKELQKLSVAAITISAVYKVGHIIIIINLYFIKQVDIFTIHTKKKNIKK